MFAGKKLLEMVSNNYPNQFLLHLYTMKCSNICRVGIGEIHVNLILANMNLCLVLIKNIKYITTKIYIGHTDVLSFQITNKKVFSVTNWSASLHNHLHLSNKQGI